MGGLYIHIPFCRTKCPYCDFVSETVQGDVPAEYLNAIHTELSMQESGLEISSVFFGGGTPSLINPEDLDGLLGRLDKHFRLTDPEITLEANADDVTAERVRQWKTLGINRLSIGVQSFCDETLQYLGRRHDAETARRACALVAERFDNWNMDLIFGARPVHEWIRTLEECQHFAPPHLSAYGLTYEDETPFRLRRDNEVDDAQWLDLYWKTDDLLPLMSRYEISNFSKSGFECRHTLIYWHNEEYIGLGAAAYGFQAGTRYRNCISWRDYMAEPGLKSDVNRLTCREMELETVIQCLRLRAGLSRRYYERRFGAPVETRFGDSLRQLVLAGLLVADSECYRPTRKGFEMNNEIGLALIDLENAE